MSIWVKNISCKLQTTVCQHQLHHHQPTRKRGPAHTACTRRSAMTSSHAKVCFENVKRQSSEAQDNWKCSPFFPSPPGSLLLLTQSSSPRSVGTVTLRRRPEQQWPSTTAASWKLHSKNSHTKWCAQMCNAFSFAGGGTTFLMHSIPPGRSATSNDNGFFSSFLFLCWVASVVTTAGALTATL